MLGFAIKMILNDRTKFLAMLIGLTFATFIMTQQAGIFIGLMQRTYGFITDTSQNNIWVVDRGVQHVDDIKPIKSTKLYQVRGFEELEWAVPMYKGILHTRLPSGAYQNCNVIGIDNTTLIGGPPWIVEGSIYELLDQDAIIVDAVAAKGKLASNKVPLQLGDKLEINDRRAVVRGFCHVTRTFASQPVIYTTYERALSYAPSERNLLSFILVKSKPGVKPEELCKKISRMTGLAAYTRNQFIRLTVSYYLLHTGIPINFGLAVALGFIIGAAIAGQTFYTFAYENQRYFATCKAMGASRNMLISMVVVQGLVVAGIGWGLGIGLAAIFGLSGGGTELSFTLPFWLLIASALAIFLITLFAALISIYKILRVQPSTVFAS
ncbi:MAG: hypothetical protein S4CHLAM81_14320 [Chlamydiales bacterium]|nr:hypothetical protein [Chlamydiales bacterium]MCH9636204.1 hypothetical protein [Chlamydiales bacterium]MCH9703357.1 ABC transporter permease [Chlamydiota bacterium]